MTVGADFRNVDIGSVSPASLSHAERCPISQFVENKPTDHPRVRAKFLIDKAAPAIQARV